MNRTLSIYLDLVRLSAALVVFVGHLAGERFTGGLFWQASLFMGEAVMIFFVISGFVIGYVVFERRESRDDYIVARIVRIASVAVPALVATLLLDQFGQALRPGAYAATWGFSDQSLWRQYLGGALFLNQLWYSDVPVGSNLPYWSLNFEVWYYVLFGIAAFATGTMRVLLLATAVLICGPTIMVLFPVWLMGLLAHRVCVSGRVGHRAGLALFLGSAALLVAYLGSRAAGLATLPQGPAMLNRPEILHEYLVAALFAVNLVGCAAAAPSLGRLLLPVARPIRWAAGATFTIYLFHLPLAQFMTTILPWPPESLLNRVVMLGSLLVLLYGIAAVTERRKDVWKPAAQMLLRLARTAMPGHRHLGSKA
jgi:peptidoglycan/LPS O-acetylase OafA/YrhL